MSRTSTSRPAPRLCIERASSEFSVGYGARVSGAVSSDTPVGLERTLGYRELVFYGLAYIAPVAPLSTLGFVWNASNGLIVLSIARCVCMYFTAQSYATMTGTIANAGLGVRIRATLPGPIAGFIAGWMILLDYLLIPALVYVLIAVALQRLMPGVDRAVWIVCSSRPRGGQLVRIAFASRANFVSVGLQLAVLVDFLVLAC